jgi:hypothetical protein
VNGISAFTFHSLLDCRRFCSGRSTGAQPKISKSQGGGCNAFSTNRLRPTESNRNPSAMESGSGPGGRRFKSSLPDHIFSNTNSPVVEQRPLLSHVIRLKSPETLAHSRTECRHLHKIVYRGGAGDSSCWNLPGLLRIGCQRVILPVADCRHRTAWTTPGLGYGPGEFASLRCRFYCKSARFALDHPIGVP